MNERKKIVVADNQELDLEFLGLMLSKLGFEVEQAADGKTALEKIKQKKADMAIVNTILPKISGWEVLKTVKKDDEIAGTQIMLLSDIDNIKEQVESFEAGAVDYIVKPFNFSVLVARIRSLLRNKEYYYELGKLDGKKA